MKLKGLNGYYYMQLRILVKNNRPCETSLSHGVKRKLLSFKSVGQRFWPYDFGIQNQTCNEMDNAFYSVASVR